MIKNVTIAAIVQRPNILEILARRSNTSCAIVVGWLKMVGCKMPQFMSQFTPSAICRSIELRTTRRPERVSFGIPTPNSVAQCKFLKCLIGKKTMAYFVLTQFRLHSE